MSAEITTMNKEQIYDSEIYPLMDKIAEICKARKIAMFATFDIPNDEDAGLCCTTHLPDESGELPDRMKACVRSAGFGSTKFPPLMLTTEHADGSKTLTAIHG